MKLEIRKCVEYTVHEATTSINLDMEEFKTLSIPFTGESEQEFLGYIRDEFEWEEVFEELTPETQAKISLIFDCPEYEQTYNSAFDGENSWFESGEKYGDDFNIIHNNFA
jgi:hypothetical protein